MDRVNQPARLLAAVAGVHVQVRQNSGTYGIFCGIQIMNPRHLKYSESGSRYFQIEGVEFA